MVALDPPRVRHVPLEEATHRRNVVSLDSDTILTARELGVCLGDAASGPPDGGGRRGASVRSSPRVSSRTAAPEVPEVPAAV